MSTPDPGDKARLIQRLEKLTQDILPAIRYQRKVLIYEPAPSSLKKISA